MDARTVHRESRREVRPHRQVVLDLDRAALEGRLAVILREVRDVQVEIRCDHAPRGLMILIRELAPRRTKIAERRRERPLALTRGVAAELREVTAAVPLFDQHLPVGHLDRRDREVGPPAENTRPVEAQFETSCGEERPIGRGEPVYREVLSDYRAAQHVNRQPADVDGGLDWTGGLPLGEEPEGWPEIDRQRRDDRGRQNRDRQLDRASAEHDGPLRARSGEYLHHWMTTSSAPASTEAPSTARNSPTTPSRLALSSFSIFIASTTTTVCRARTASPILTPTRTILPGMGATIRCGPDPESALRSCLRRRPPLTATSMTVVSTRT